MTLNLNHGLLLLPITRRKTTVGQSGVKICESFTRFAYLSAFAMEKWVAASCRAMFAATSLLLGALPFRAVNINGNLIDSVYG